MLKSDPLDPLKCLIPDPHPRSPEPDPHSRFPDPWSPLSFELDFSSICNKYTHYSLKDINILAQMVSLINCQYILWMDLPGVRFPRWIIVKLGFGFCFFSFIYLHLITPGHLYCTCICTCWSSPARGGQAPGYARREAGRADSAEPAGPRLSFFFSTQNEPQQGAVA